MTTGERLQITRQFEFPAQRVFDAWLDPEVAGKWLFTTSKSEQHSMESDPRVGGKWKITDRRDGLDYTAIGEYVEIESPHRLVFSFGIPQFSEKFARVTVEIKATAVNTCALMLTHEPLPADAVVGLKKGWTEMLDELSQCLNPTNSVPQTMGTR